MVKIMLAETEGPGRTMLREIVRKIAGSDLAWDVCDVDEALRRAEQECPDLILLSHGLVMRQLAATVRSFVEKAPGARILVLSTLNDSRLALRAIEAGASGYMLADRTYEELPEAVRTIMTGRTYLSPGIAGKERVMRGAEKLADDVHPEAMHGSSGTARTSRQPRVLVVDDEDALLEIYRKVLDDAGYTVLTATTAEEALAHLQAGPPDLAFVDLVLPGKSGVEVIRAIKAFDETLPVVVVTGYPNSDLMYQAMTFSPLTVLLKPFPPKRLAETARSALAARVNLLHGTGESPGPMSAEECTHA